MNIRRKNVRSRLDVAFGLEPMEMFVGTRDCKVLLVLILNFNH